MSLPSYVHGASPVALLGETIGANLRRTVDRFGDRDALVAPAQEYRATYRQLWDTTTTLAKALLARFGSLARVLEAEPAALAKTPGMGEAGAAAGLTACQTLADRREYVLNHARLFRPGEFEFTF